MAKTTFSGIGITEMRNKLGAEVHFRNRGGSVVRAYASPIVNPNQTGLDFRELYADITLMWQSLPDDVRAEWNEFASSMSAVPSNINSKHLSGFNWFMKQCTGIFVTGNFPTFLPVVPVFTSCPIFISVTTLSAAMVELKVAGPGGGTVVLPDTYLVIFASVGVSAGIMKKKTGINMVAVYPPGTDAESLDITADYVALYGAPVVGQKIFFGACCYSSIDGDKSVRLVTSAIVT